MGLIFAFQLCCDDDKFIATHTCINVSTAGIVYQPAPGLVRGMHLNHPVLYSPVIARHFSYPKTCIAKINSC